MNFLVAYATTDGQTADIAARIGERLREAGHLVEVTDIAALPQSLDAAEFDAVLIGGSLHAQGYQRRVRQFVTRQLPALQTRPSAFFSVCLATASKRPAERAEAELIPRRFVENLKWQPDAIEVIAGALRFSRYGLLRRLIMKAIAQREMAGAVDANRDHVLTDWSQVDAFATTFAELVAARTSARTGSREPAGWPAP